MGDRKSDKTLVCEVNAVAEIVAKVAKALPKIQFDE